MTSDPEATGTALTPAEQRERLAALVQKSLGDILHSVPFRHSKQCQRFLQYIVDQSLAGHPELLKERIIGIEVFGRATDYDTNSDPVVRTRAAEVRKRLAQYYVGDGSASAIRIEIPAGSYHATFAETAQQRQTESRPGRADEDAPHAFRPDQETPSAIPTQPGWRRISPGMRGRILLVTLLLLIPILGLTAYTAYIVKPADRAVQPDSAAAKFWAPIFDAQGPILVYTGSNPVYMLSPSFIKRYKHTHRIGDLDELGYELSIPTTSSHVLTSNDFVLKNDTYITIGDLSANVSLAKFFAGHHKQFNSRLAGDVAFGDLRDSPSVLVGAFNNRWTLRMTKGLRYAFYKGDAIKDQAKRDKDWTMTYSQSGHVITDYALIARLIKSGTGKPLIAVAGIGESGTQAAAEFITHNSDLREVAGKLPRDWASKNVELVLKVTVVNNIPTHSSIVAMHAW